MSRGLRIKKRAQSTAEYAVVLALVVGAVVAMQVYVKRGLQGRMQDAVEHVGSSGTVGGTAFTFTSDQYEPYYLSSDQGSASSQSSNEILGTNGSTGRASTQASIVARNQTMGWNATDKTTAVTDPLATEAEAERNARPATPAISTETPK